MQSACSVGTGTFIEKTARKLQIPPEQLSEMRYTGYTLHKDQQQVRHLRRSPTPTLC